jgi:hypothetical protein
VVLSLFGNLGFVQVMREREKVRKKMKRKKERKK